MVCEALTSVSSASAISGSCFRSWGRQNIRSYRPNNLPLLTAAYERTSGHFSYQNLAVSLCMGARKTRLDKAPHQRWLESDVSEFHARIYSFELAIRLPLYPFPTPFPLRTMASELTTSTTRPQPVAIQTSIPVATSSKVPGSPISATSSTFPQVVPDVASQTGRNLILCFDGTGDQYDQDVRSFFCRDQPIWADNMRSTELEHC
ncbi:hypothetical protein AG1IA_02943 [Rhizoctonia solani AG-1 IA]|uniref:DUF2235 domain-containing protein n=1 Tax=Thanatephorus cucumeris (strain AG1-IA) TaxID=983506 RepID=L8X318_THACA|nr:hypothetical protein AG1IA_02943 [Rhizoctonia solani AG-1 IA]